VDISSPPDRMQWRQQSYPRPGARQTKADQVRIYLDEVDGLTLAEKLVFGRRSVAKEADGRTGRFESGCGSSRRGLGPGDRAGWLR
jgi:hypothetical protein